MQSGLLLPPGLAKGKRPQLYRDERQVTIGTSDTLILGSNNRRWAVMFGTPVATAVAGGQSFQSKTVSIAGAVDTGAGIILSYTAPANTNALVTNMAFYQKTGASLVCAFNYIPNGGSSLRIKNNPTSDLPLAVNLPLAPGDQANIQIVTPGTGTMDGYIGVQEYNNQSGTVTTDNTVFISLDGTATVNGGMPLHPGNDNFVLLYDHVGQAMRESIRGIASNASVTLTVWDIFEVGCPCSDA